MRRADVQYIAIHCSATPPDVHVDAAVIDAWHRAKGWAGGIGYHYVICRDGKREAGRPLNQRGAHVEGYNSISLGICLAGGVRRSPDQDGQDDADGPRWDLTPEDNFTVAQYTELAKLLRELRAQYPLAKIWGHNQFPGVTKACPSFNVPAWLTKTGIR